MVPDQTWQEVLLTQGLLLLGAVARYAVAWLTARATRIEDETGEE